MNGQILIHSFAGLFWTIAYVLIVLRSRRDRTYGMPIAALGANVAWEFYYTVIAPPTYASAAIYHAQLTIDAIWLLIDCGILWYALRYGPSEFPGLSRPAFYVMFALVFFGAGFSDILINRDYHDRYGLRASFLQALMMSLLFLYMLYSRRSLRGQSLGIAVSKMLGTAFASLGVYLHPPLPEYSSSELIHFLYIAAFVADLVYVVAVYSMSTGRFTGLIWRTETTAATTATTGPVEDRAVVVRSQ